MHQIFADLWPFESFCKLFTAYCLEVIVYQRLIWAYNIAMLLWCVLRQKALLPRSSKTSPLISWPAWTLSLQFTKYQQRLCPNEFFLIFFFFCNSTYSLYSEHWIIQEPVNVLHLITCHGHIMPRLAELLLIHFKNERLSDILQAVKSHISWSY